MTKSKTFLRKKHFTHPVIKRNIAEQSSSPSSPEAKCITSKPSVNLPVGHTIQKATIFCLVEIIRQVLESEKPKFEFGSVISCEKYL